MVSLKILTVLVLLVSTLSAKSLNKRSDNDVENEIEQPEEIVLEPVLTKEAKNVEEKEVTAVEDGTTSTERPSTTPEGLEETTTKRIDHIIDPTTASNTTDGNNTRSSRNTPHLREVETPSMVIENFRNKLKEAHKSLHDSLLARKASEQPKPFMFEPSADRHKHIKPTLNTFAVGRPTEEAPNKEAKKIITSPFTEDSSSSSEERNNQTGPQKSGPTMRQSSNPEDISHLLHVRDEINKIRHMMQTLREQQLRQQFGAQFPHTRNLTEDETASLTTIIEKLKDQGKISTKPLTTDDEEPSSFQNHPPETTKLIEDVKKLKESVLSFAKSTSGTGGNVEDLEKQIQQQREEIEALKKLVDDLQPPKTFPTNPSMLKHPQNVKSDLHKELKTLQDILNELLKKEEAKEKMQLRAADGVKPKTDEEIGTLMKIFNSMAHPSAGNRQSDIESKLEKLERELKELDNQNQRTRHEILLQKLEHDVRALKSEPKDKPVMSPLAAKISQLENQLKALNAPESKSTNVDLPTSIDRELDNLQKEIDLMALKNLQKSGGDTMSSRQLEGLFTEILTPPGENIDSSPAIAFDKLKGIIKPPVKPPIIVEHSVEPLKVPIAPHPQPVFQLPFCLQKYPHINAYVPQYHQHTPTIHHNPVPIETIQSGPYSSQFPSKTIINHHGDVHNPIIPQEVYGSPIENHKQHFNEYQKPIIIEEPAKKYQQSEYQKPIEHQKQETYKKEQSGYNNNYQKPIDHQESDYNDYQKPIKHHEQKTYNKEHEYANKQQSPAQGYNNEYQKPIKQQEQQSYSQEPIKVEEYANKQQSPAQGYNNEYQKPIKHQEQSYNNEPIKEEYANKQQSPAQGYNNEYQKPVKHQEQSYNKEPIKEEYANKQQSAAQGYNNEYQKPVKHQKQQSYNKEPVKVQEYANKQQSAAQGYNNEYQKQIKPQEHQTYNKEPVKVQEPVYQEPTKQQNSYQNAPNQQQYSSGYDKEQQAVEDHPSDYNNEEYQPVEVQIVDQYNKPEIIHHVYQPSVPQATPIKIEYQHNPEPEQNHNYGYPEDKMAYYKPSCQHHANIDEEINHLNGMIGTLDEKIGYDGQNYDLYRSKDYKPRNKRAVDEDYDKKDIYKDIQKRLNNLRAAVESSDFQNYPVSAENEIESDFQRTAYNGDDYQPYDVKYKKKQKFDNLFIKIVKFILHKLEISAPYIVQSLFDGEAYEVDDSYGTPYRNRNSFTRGSEDSYEDASPFGGLFSSFQGFPGLLGFIPTVLLKLLSNFSSFLTILKRNNFFKNFLFPGALILAVDGIMAILVWWFSTDENHGLISYRNSTNHQY